MDLQDICVSCFAGGMVPAKEPAGQITFQNVSFTYPSRPDTRVIHNLTLDIPEASITAVVGASGSGKSTLAALLLRLYDPDSGTVLLDGQPVGQLDPRWLRSHIGSVSQVCEPRHFDCHARLPTAQVTLHCLSSHINSCQIFVT
jgi:ABC-type bacteriocin/lantibiotic exporters, contain an N-terminal double-glycine peptidase domain